MPMPLSIPLKLPPFPYGLLSYLLPGRLTSPSNTPPPPPSPPPTNISSSPSRPAGQPDTAEEPARVFELFDRDGDGRITREELAESLGRLGIPVPACDELASVIARVDADGDGCVDAAEFGELYRVMMAKEGEEEEEGEMKEAFRVFDADGDGYITEEELGAVLAALGLVRQGRAAEDCRRMIGRVDGDGDGRVNFQEFVHMMRDAGGFAALG